MRRLFDILGISVMLLVVFFIYNALSGEHLPELIWPTQKKPYHALKENEKEKARERRRKQAALRGHSKTKANPSLGKFDSDEGVRAAFYAPWDAASFASLREYARQVDLLYPDWLHVLTDDGHLQGVDDQTNKYFDVIQGSAVHPVDDKVMPFLKSENTGMEVFPMVNNSDGVSWVDITSFLNDTNARERFRQQVAAFLVTDKYRGLMVDFEEIAPKAQPGYMALLQEISNDLHAKGMKLYVSVPPHNEDFNYPAVASLVDGVVLMNYDEHYPEGTSGPVASQDWFVVNLEFARKVVPLDKLICAIGNYGYDWVQKPKHGKLPPDVRDTNVSVQEAWLAARDSEEDIDFDGDSSNPHFSYMDEQNRRHDIWFLDAVTALNQMRAAQRLGIPQLRALALGAEDRSSWRLDVPGEPAAPDKLKDVLPGQDVDMEGQGEILRIEARPANGKREITVDPASGIIEDETIDPLPEPYRVARYGYNAKAVAITFDDGPDPQWTPKILDVLKQENASATFFLIGLEAKNFGGVTSRIYREGHEIGNHTFTHPDISNLSHSYMKVELNLTEQLFASRLGIHTILFARPIRLIKSRIRKTRSGRLKLCRIWATSAWETKSIPTTGKTTRDTRPSRSRLTCSLTSRPVI